MFNSKKKFWKKSNPPSQNNKIKEVKNYEVSPRNGYFGFQLYFSDDELQVAKVLDNVKSFEAYIERNISRFPIPQMKKTCAFPLDLKLLLTDEDFIKEWFDFSVEIIEKTEYCLSCMGLAMHQTVYNQDREKFLNNSERSKNIFVKCPVIHCRLINNEPILRIKNLRVNAYGKLVSVRGTVIKASTLKSRCQQMSFACGSCTGIQVVKQVDGNYTPPDSCPSKNCNVRTGFIPLFNSEHTKTVNSQTLKLQDLAGDDNEDQGRLPRTVECELMNDLVGRCKPGDDVTITGIVKVHKGNEVLKSSKQPSVFLLFLEVVSIVNEKNSNAGLHPGIHFNQKDYYAIQKIHSEPGLFRFLVHSLCPKIYGHEVVKAGLLLALFGGAKNPHNTRSDSHVLIVGDPGLGKSQLLQACCNVAPRGVYVCGNTSTSSGLTVTLTRESGSDYSMEAGALMLADQGCLCIDEFDKMGNQHTCLLEAMEQQTISIAKATINCTLTTRSSILAAANPAGGHYNKAKTVSENLKMGSPLLSRFDLVFILLDQPNKDLDLLLSEHVLALHSGRKNLSSRCTSQATQSSTQIVSLNLKDRLKLLPGETIETLPHALFRKYIAYAQKYVKPVLNREAQKVLQEFYLELRRNYHKKDSTPVTNRQIDSLVRLTQARAKIELREEATGEDAIDVVDVYRHSLVDIFSDTTGKLDFNRSQNGTGVSNKKQMTMFLKALKHKSEVVSQSTFAMNDLKELAEQLGIAGSIFGIIDSLNIQGYLIKKPENKYQLTIGG